MKELFRVVFHVLFLATLFAAAYFFFAGINDLMLNSDRGGSRWGAASGGSP